MTRLVCLVLAAIAVVPATHTVAQDVPQQTVPAVDSVSRFEGVVTLRQEPVRVEITLWTISGGQTVRFSVPPGAVLLVELRGGELVAVTNEARADRREGEIWALPAGSSLELSTINETAIFQTTLVGG